MTMEYTVIRSRRRTMALEVTREAKLLVRAPLWASKRDIERFVASHRQWAQIHLARRQAYLAEHPPLTEAEIADLRARAKAELPGRVALWAARMGVEPAGVRITSARTRFGSCSGKNSLSFSLYLMQHPPEAIDYVVVHELAHIRHRNHGPAFYAEVAKYLPDYRQRQALLRH
jgi:predicted metal-dependent hydrolase